MAAVLGSGIWIAAAAERVTDDTTVYFLAGKGRFHTANCKRMKGHLESSPDTVTKMTHKQGVAKGLMYCSRCPVDASLKASSSGSGGGGSAAVTIHKDVTSGALVSVGASGRLVYRPYTDKGDVIMDYSFCGYKASEVPIPDIPTVLTLNPLPGTPAPVQRKAPKPVADAGEKDGGPMVFFIPGKERFHAEGCPRLRAAQELKTEMSQISYRKGASSGLQYCSRCPKDAPKVEIAAEPTDRKVTLAYPEGPDSFKRIQAAIDKVAAMKPGSNGFRGAVLLTKGTYYINGGLHLTSGVVLRGEGDGESGTVLVVRNPKGAAITLGWKAEEASAPSASSSPVFTTRITDTYVPVGSKSLHVKDVGPFKVGQYVRVIKTANQAWIDTLGMGDPGGGKSRRKSKPWTPKAYRLHHIRQITAIDGNRLTFKAPLPQGVVAEHGGGEVAEYKNSKRRIAHRCRRTSRDIQLRHFRDQHDEGAGWCLCGR